MSRESHAPFARRQREAALREFFRSMDDITPLQDVPAAPVVAEFASAIVEDFAGARSEGLFASRPRLNETEGLMDVMYCEEADPNVRMAAAMLLFHYQAGKDINPEARDMGLGLVLELSSRIPSDRVRIVANVLAACLTDPNPYRCLSMERLALAGLQAIASRKDAEAAVLLLGQERDAYTARRDIGSHPPDLGYSESVRARFLDAIAKSGQAADSASEYLREYATSV